MQTTGKVIKPSTVSLFPGQKFLSSTIPISISLQAVLMQLKLPGVTHIFTKIFFKTGNISQGSHTESGFQLDSKAKRKISLVWDHLHLQGFVIF